MAGVVIKQIPNALTTLRLILAIPICLLILNENYQAVLWVAFIAGLSDGVDGWLARKLGAESRYGAIVDPLSDKALLIGVYGSLAVVGLLPWWVTIIVVVRDMVILGGALAYHWRFGRYAMEPSLWGKISTCVQIAFALLLLTNQVFPVFPEFSLQIGLWLVILLAAISGGHYIYIWGGKAAAVKKEQIN